MPIYHTTSKKETQKLATDFASKLNGGEVFCLFGELGSGKTTFVQGFLRALGVTRAVTSPTFVLEKIYPINHPRINRVVHIDAYRIGTDATPPLDLADHLGAPETVTLIEWPEHLANELHGVASTRITFQIIGKSKRSITFSDPLSP